MALLKYKNPNYVVGGNEEKYLPLSNVIVSESIYQAFCFASLTL